MKIAKEEMSLVDVVHFILSSKKTIFLILGISFFLGILISFTSPSEWKTVASLVPENNNTKGSSGGLSSLAGAAGISLSGGSVETINPTLYPNIGSSTPFLLAVADHKISLKESNETITVEDYISKRQKKSFFKKVAGMPMSLWSLVKGGGSNEINENINPSVNKISSSKRGVLNALKQRITVSFDNKQNIVSIEVKMQNAFVSAQVTQFTIDYISNFVSDYSTSRETRKLEFIEIQLKAKKDSFVIIQEKLAKFKDTNVLISNNAGRGELDNLQSEYNLAFDLYSSLQRQREEVLIKVQENTIVFLALEPALVPSDRFAPKRSQIMTSSLFLGLFFSLIYLFGHKYLLHFLKSFKAR